MNQLSWLLYLGGASENLSFLMGFFAFGLGITMCGTAVWHFATKYDRDRVDAEPYFPAWPLCVSSALFVVMAFGATLLPSKETVYAIAASEMGERALKSPLVSKAEKALEAWLDEQIKVPDAK